MVPLRGRIYKPLPGGSIINHKSQKLNYLRMSRFTKVVCFQKLAEVSQKYLHKGARIAVIGTLDHHKWETDEGIQRASFQLMRSQSSQADNANFLDSHLLLFLLSF
jgi:single-stranded DNA-binding protein